MTAILSGGAIPEVFDYRVKLEPEGTFIGTLNEVRVQGAALAAKSEEEKTLRAQFDADIQRYRELHAIHEQ